MKKIIFQSPFILFFMGAAFTRIETRGNSLPDSIPKGWRAFTNNAPDIVIGTDTAIRHSGKASGFIQRPFALKPSTGNVTMMQFITADPYRNKRVRLTVYARSEGLESGALFYFRVDGTDTVLAYANTAANVITETTEWTLYHITLDVPEAAIIMYFGVVMREGQGTIWVDDFNFEVVDNSIPSDVKAIGVQPKNTDMKKPSVQNAKARNLGFEDR